MTKIDIKKFWIEGVLTERYRDFVEKRGADLDGNGVIERTEVFEDFNGDGYLGDRQDYQTYLEKNRPQLSAAIPFFKYGERLGVHNRIHQMLYLESDLHAPQLIASAYKFLADLNDKVGEKMGGSPVKPEVLAQTIYGTMTQGMGVVFKNQDDASLVANIRDRRLDCDTSSFVAMAVGDERGLRLELVRAPEHFFLRGIASDDHHFNIDVGHINPDDHYRRGFGIAPESERQGVYLRNLDDKGLEGEFLTIRAQRLQDAGRNEEALAAYDRALQLDSTSVAAYSNRGNVLGELGRTEEALNAQERAIQLDPQLAKAHVNLAYALESLGRLEEALATLDHAIQLNPYLAVAHHNRGMILRQLGRYREALSAFERAIELEPSRMNWQFQIGLPLLRLLAAEPMTMGGI